MIELQKDQRSKTSPANARKGGRPAAPPYYKVAAEYILNQEFDQDSSEATLLHWRNSWYKHDGAGWRTWSEEDIQKSLITYLEDHTDYGPWATPHYIRGLISHMKGFNLCGLVGSVNTPVWLGSKKEAKNWMTFTNGKAVTLNGLAKGWSNGKTSKSISPDLFTTDYVEYPFDPKAKCPRFQKFLKRSLPSRESRETVQEMLGLLLMDTCKYEVFFYLYGPTARNGKTVLLNIIRALVGRHNVSHVGLDNLCTRFETWPLAEAKVNVYGDMATDTGRATLAHVEGLFKDLVSGANLEYQKKGKDKFVVPCRARFVFAGNSLPSFVDRSDAIWERLRVIHFPVQIPKRERDPNLADRIIKKEISGVFNWAVKGMVRVLKNRGVKDRSEGITLKSSHRLECDHESKFIFEKGYQKGMPRDFMAKAKIYESYRRWMDENGYRAKGAGRFYDRLTALIPGLEAGQQRIKGIPSPVKGFWGLKI